MSLRFDHVALRCTDIEKMKAFFTEIIGLTVGYRPPFTFPGFWLYTDKNCLLHLFADSAHSHARAKTNRNTPVENTIVDHLALWSDDCEGIMTKVKKNNLNFSETTIPESNIRQVFIQAPENLLVEMDFPVVL